MPKKLATTPAKVKLPDELTVEWAKTLMPKAKGCAVSLELKWHRRWCAEYLLRPDGPKYRKRNFCENKRSQQGALLEVLQWSWAVHLEVMGEQCPHDWNSFRE